MTNEQDKVTVTVTENGAQVFSSTENTVFIVGEHKGLTAVSCRAEELFAFAVRVQVQFLKNIIAKLLPSCNPNVTADMLFNAIAEIAKEAVTE